MANADHLERLRQGSDAWNAWRTREPSVKPDLREADLGGAHLSGADLREAQLYGAILSRADLGGARLGAADLSEADLEGTNFYGADLHRATLHYAHLSEATLGAANLSEADLSGADLRGADLRKAHLNRANLGGADLGGADLGQANLGGADLGGADLGRAGLFEADLTLVNFVDANLDGAELTGARLWETQRGGWSIKGVICRHAFWDREATERTEYEEGEFERIFAEKPRIVLHYAKGMSPIDLLALPLVLEQLQAERPGIVLQVRSVQNDAGGASVTITVEDLEDRAPEMFRQDLTRVQTKLEYVIEERDRIQRRLDSIVSQGMSMISEFLALPRQENHIYNPSGLTTIEGPAMKRDTYINSGQAGAVGPGARAEGNTFQQIHGNGDLPKLAEELGRLRGAMKGEATGTREQDKAIGAVADAEEAAAGGDGPAALDHLKGAGKWALGIAEKIGVAVAAEALKRAM